MDRECLERKLDFHAPLLSTRRPGRIIVPREKWDVDSSSGFNERVPFSWEQSPGKPKEIPIRSRRVEGNTNTSSNLSFLLPLKPPPIRLHPHSRPSKDSSSKQEADDEEDDGCDADVDDNVEDRDFFYGGLDLFSLAESSESGNGNGIATRKQSRRVVGKAGGGGRRRAPPTPNYIMERFLPAAVALAATSSSYFAMEARGEASSGLGFRGYESDSPPSAAHQVCTPTNTNTNTNTNRNVGGRRVLPSVTSSPILAFKTCGLHNLLPWQPKPKKSAIRGPFRFGCSDWKPQLSPRPNYRS